MADGGQTKVRPNRHHTPVDWVALAFVLAYAALHCYCGLTAGSVSEPGSIRNFAVAAAALGGVVVYFSPYWRPVLYLVGAVFVGTLTVFWGLREPITVFLEAGRVALGAALVVLLTHLFNRERIRYERAAG